MNNVSTHISPSASSTAECVPGTSGVSVVPRGVCTVCVLVHAAHGVYISQYRPDTATSKLRPHRQTLCSPAPRPRPHSHTLCSPFPKQRPHRLYFLLPSFWKTLHFLQLSFSPFDVRNGEGRDMERILVRK